MQSWIYIFSKFTNEALFFEAFIICLLAAVYSAYWVAKKRKYGAIDKQPVPNPVARAYINHLIIEAQTLRTQLFGLLQDAGMEMPMNFGVGIPTHTAPAAHDAHATPVAISTEGGGLDAAGAQRLAELEAKIVEQTKAMESMISEKSKFEGELQAAKTAAAAGGGGAAGDDSALRKRIKELEDRLAEYSVIEDDLANLKRLQQENTQLKAAIEGKGGMPAAAAAAAPAPTSEPTVETTTPAANASTPESPAPDQLFEKLVDQVEQSLAPEPAPSPEPVAAAAPVVEAAPEVAPTPAPVEAPAAVAAPSAVETPAPVAAAPAPAQGSETAEAKPADAKPAEGKKDEDLISEFEKMLNM